MEGKQIDDSRVPLRAMIRSVGNHLSCPNCHCNRCDGLDDVYG